MKRLPFKVFILMVLAVFSMSSLAPAYAETAFKWYNPLTWMYDNGRPSKEKAKATEVRKAKPSQSRWSKSSKKLTKDHKKKEKTKKKNGKTEVGAVIETEKGNITIRLYPKDAPTTVDNFKELVEGKFYDKPGMKFHRVVPGFVIQTGDPTGTGYGGSGHKIPLEVKNKLSHDGRGVIAMARGPLPNSATSQFYITLKKHTQLDGKYAVFGQVIQGLDILEKIEKDDRLYGIKLIDVSERIAERRSEDQSMLNKIFGNF